MKSLNKGFFFIILLVVLGGVLVIRSNFFKFNSTPNLTDRLPTSDFLVQVKTLSLSKEINAVLFKHKLPIREFASPDFMLSQAKNYGINIQSPAYLFFNETRDEWGAMLQVNDSSKLINVFERFSKNTELIDSSNEDTRIFHFSELNIKVAYEQNYLFIYSGNKFNERLTHIHGAQQGATPAMWMRFFKHNSYKKEHLVVYSEANTIKSWGFDYALFSHDNDTSMLSIKCKLFSKNPHGISIQRRSAGLPFSKFDKKSIELHVSPNLVSTKTGIKIINQLHTYGKKISFPTAMFFDAWDGNLSFREGGSVAAKQRIVTSEFDENFNVSEVVKFQDIQVPGYTVAFNTKKNKGKLFINELFKKGLLRTEDNKLVFLFSPLLSMQNENQQYLFTSALQFPELIPNSANQIQWEVDGYRYRFKLGRITKNSVELHGYFPINPLIKYIQKSKFEKEKKEIKKPN